MTTIYDDQRLDSGVFDFVEPLSREDKKARRKQQRHIRRQLRRKAGDESQSIGDFPVRRWGYGGPARKNAGRGMGTIRVKGIRTTTRSEERRVGRECRCRWEAGQGRATR